MRPVGCGLAHGNRKGFGGAGDGVDDGAGAGVDHRNAVSTMVRYHQAPTVRSDVHPPDRAVVHSDISDHGETPPGAGVDKRCRRDLTFGAAGQTDNFNSLIHIATQPFSIRRRQTFTRFADTPTARFGTVRIRRCCFRASVAAGFAAERIVFFNGCYLHHAAGSRCA
ncbi:hypothetical protein MBOT_22770 [Mycobacterium botniense]|uniref:Uncharacterized protein n=1 Tax=Mycobacterium botniense TaxID=84962 RepID=A0A7I9XYM5_9MYCO|nr:hypothetical protein MBOT_22770 [Mycobacterium botniense]